MDQASQYIHAATYLPLRRWSDIPAFLLLSRRITTRMKTLPGMIAYDLRARPLSRLFLTTSVWANAAAIGGLMATAEHQEAVRRFHDWADEGAKTATWTSSNPKPDWAEAMEHLEKNARPVEVRRAK